MKGKLSMQVMWKKIQIEMMDTVLNKKFLKTIGHLFSTWGDFASKGTFGNTTPGK